VGLLGRPAEAAVRTQDPDAHTERPPDRPLAIEAGRPIRLRDKDGDADLTADLVHPSRINPIDMLHIKYERTSKTKKRTFRIKQNLEFQLIFSR
jgi:hypothetical protein